MKYKELCDLSITNLKSKITVQKSELKSNISVNLKTRRKEFEWKNLYKELFENKNWSFDLEKLESLIDSDFFSDSDKNHIEWCLKQFMKSNDKKHIKRLKKFFKNKQRINEDLWIDLELKIEDLYNESLIILREMFRGDYFKKYILPHFNIYLFLKSKEPFHKYIKRQYNLEKLKWYRKNFKTIDDTIVEVDDYYKERLNRISEDNSEATDVESLDQVGQFIEGFVNAIKEQIEKITIVEETTWDDEKSKWSYKNSKNKK